jgi:hypothetical protein
MLPAPPSGSEYLRPADTVSARTHALDERGGLRSASSSATAYATVANGYRASGGPAARSVVLFTACACGPRVHVSRRRARRVDASTPGAERAGCSGGSPSAKRTAGIAARGATVGARAGRGGTCARC